jgi:hypothetical protein
MGHFPKITTPAPVNLQTPSGGGPGQPHTKFIDTGVQPPSRFYITQSEFLVVKILSSVASPALSITTRLIGPDGEVARNLDLVGAVTAGTLSTQLFKLGEGFLLDVCVSAFGTTLQRGQTFVSVGIQFGGATGQTPFMCLAADYVTNTMPVTWPGGLIRSSVDGPGWSGSIVSSTPAAGAQLTWTVPTGLRFVPITMYTLFTCSAAVANRLVQWNIKEPGGTILYKVSNTTNITASQVYSIYLSTAPALTDTVANILVLPTPIGFSLLAGSTVNSGFLNLQAADQIGSLIVQGAFYVEA